MEYNPFTPPAHADLDVDGNPVQRGIWSEAEHERFLEGMKLNPLGPWRAIADHVATRSTKQVQTHAQKYQQKVARRRRGLQKQKTHATRQEHRVDQAASGCIKTARNFSHPNNTDIGNAAKRWRNSRTAVAPSSPSSCEQWLTQPPVKHSIHHSYKAQLAARIQNIEPIPFSAEEDDSDGAFEWKESLRLFLL